MLREVRLLTGRLPQKGGTLGAPASFPCAFGLTIRASDVNGDGKPDLVVDAGTALNVLLGDGTGQLAPGVRVASSGAYSYLMGFATGDFNGDGFADIAVVWFYSASHYRYASGIYTIMGCK